MKTPEGNTAAIVDGDELSWCYSAKTNVVDQVNGKIYVITMKGWIAIPERGCPTPSISYTFSWFT